MNDRRQKEDRLARNEGPVAPVGVAAGDIDRSRSADLATAGLFAGGLSVLLNQVPGRRVCSGDCDEHGSVSIDELVRSVNVALGRMDIADCVAADANADASVTINELVEAVNNALLGCRE